MTKNNPKIALAIDIGASSGRHILGWLENGELQTKEVYRFRNGVVHNGSHLLWDIDSIEEEVKKGIDIAVSDCEVTSLSIDTWGVDYVLLKEDERMSDPFAYRDPRTQAAVREVHSRIPFEELYGRTGCQFQYFNTIYQLYDDLLEGRLEGATDFLMIPEYLMFRLTGNKVKEFTNATTTGLINHESLGFDSYIIDRLGLPGNLFPALQNPGKEIGTYKGISVVLCATHDTASAVEGIPMIGNASYLSSGTWSLLGVKTSHPLTDKKSMVANFSNEGGVGYNRYQKNIMGMWLVNELQKELCPEEDIASIVEKAEKSTFSGVINANDSSLLSPRSMKEAFDSLLDEAPADRYGYFRCAYRSLALSYAEAIREMEENTGLEYDSLYIVGGGAKNTFLNRLTQESTGKRVIALPMEATAIGNLRRQLSSSVV